MTTSLLPPSPPRPPPPPPEPRVLRGHEAGVQALAFVEASGGGSNRSEEGGQHRLLVSGYAAKCVQCVQLLLSSTSIPDY